MKRFFCEFNIFSLSLLLLMLLSFTSCKSAKEMVKAKDVLRTDVKIEAKPTAEELLVEEVHSLSPNFSYYSAKLDIEYGGMSYSGTLRIGKDSVIWASLGKFGIEAARLMLTKDSILFMNKLTHDYFVGDYNFIVKMLGFKLNYDIIQAILLGKDFSEYETNDFRVERNNDLVTINFLTRANSLQPNSFPKLKQALIYNSKTKRIEKNYFEIINSINKMDINYPSYITLNSISFPQQMNIIVTRGDKINITIKTEKHKVNTSLEFPFSIPKNYDLIK